MAVGDAEVGVLLQKLAEEQALDDTPQDGEILNLTAVADVHDETGVLEACSTGSNRQAVGDTPQDGGDVYPANSCRFRC